MIRSKLTRINYEDQAIRVAKELIQDIIDYKNGYLWHDAPLRRAHVEDVIERLDVLVNGILATQGGI
jgi:hypothetical protein